MAKNLFVNTTGLPIEKEMPSLIGMDLSGVGKEPLKLNIGKTISDFANKAQALKEQANTTKLYNQLADEEQAWRIEYLSDPNAFANKERRTEIAKSYNSLIERKKAIINGAKNDISAKQYSTLEGQFKQQTYDSLFELQTKMNSAFVQETVEEMNIEKNALIIRCANTIDRNEIEKSYDMLGEILNVEASIGINNREQISNIINTIESNYTEKVIEGNIINSNDKMFARLDENGNPIKDTNGNYIMDSNKILTAVTNQKSYLLSKESITPVAKRIAKKYNISEDDAYNYVHYARDKYFKVKQSTLEAGLKQKSLMEEAEMLQLEQRTINEVNKNLSITNENINKKEPITKTLSDIGLFGDQRIYYNSDYMLPFTNYKYDNVHDMLVKGNEYTNVFSSSESKSISDSLNNADNIITLKSNIDNFNNMLSKDKTLEHFGLTQIQNDSGLPIGTTRAILGKDNTISQERAIDIFFSNNNDKSDVKNVTLGYGALDNVFKDTKDLNMIFRYINSNPEKFLNAKQYEEYRAKNEKQKWYYISTEYGKSGAFKDEVNKLIVDINKMKEVSTTKYLKTNSNANSPFMTKIEDITTNNQKKLNAKTLFKNGQGDKLFNVDVNTGKIVSIVGYPRDSTGVTISDLDAYNKVLERYLNKGEITFRQINEFENGAILQNQHNIDYFTNVIIRMIAEGKLNNDNMITSIPTVLLNNSKIQEYLNKYYETQNNK